MKNTIKELLAVVWKGNKGMIDFCLKSSSYIDMGDYYLDLGDKPKIDRDMYFSDEDSQGNLVSSPKVTFNLFRNYNMSNTNQHILEDIEKDNLQVVIQSQYNNIEGLKSWAVKKTYESFRNGGRLATETEKRLIINGIKQEIEKYEKRLLSYWNRYQTKINTNTYWANA